MTVNVLPLEQYLRGRRPGRDAGRDWPQHALRAQAVASRTYAAWRRAHALDRAYDICDTAPARSTAAPPPSTRPPTRPSRRRPRRSSPTAGAPGFAEYSASNGGHTVAGGRPYLPRKPDPYEGTSPDYYGWTVTITAAQIERSTTSSDLTRIHRRARRARPVGGRVLTTDGGDGPAPTR